MDLHNFRITRKQMPFIDQLLKKGSVKVSDDNMDNVFAGTLYIRKLRKDHGFKDVKSLLDNIRHKKRVTTAKHIRFL